MPAVGDKSSSKSGKSLLAFRTISEVASELNLPQHVLRFWETKFLQVNPTKRGGKRRYYRPEDIMLLRQIRSLLYDDGYTIKGVQKLLKKPNNNINKKIQEHYCSDELMHQKAREVLSELQDIRRLL
jgi:DNA-binding transcriptional MerR regulator